MGAIADQGQLGARDLNRLFEPFERSLHLLRAGGEGLDEVSGDGELRAAARRAAAGGAVTSVPLSELWATLVSGRGRAVDTFCEHRRCSVLLSELPSAEPLASVVTPRNLELFQRVLLGEPQKVVALDFNLSDSNVACISAQLARAMGFPCCASRVPTLLRLAARASAEPGCARLAETASFTHEGKPYRIVSGRLPDPAAWRNLSEAERQIVSLLVECKSNDEIARVRRTAVRTVANQISHIMRKVGARSRREILSCLLEQQG